MDSPAISLPPDSILTRLARTGLRAARTGTIISLTAIVAAMLRGHELNGTALRRIAFGNLDLIAGVFLAALVAHGWFQFRRP